MRDVLECKICYEEFSLLDKKPKTLPCGHVFCAKCIENMMKTESESDMPKPNNTCNCPLCRKTLVLTENGTEDLPTNFHLQDLIDYLDRYDNEVSKGKQQRNCEMCPENVTTAALYSCIDCSLDLCKECNRKHSMVKATAKHDVTPISGETEPLIAMRKKKIYCQEHSDKILEFYCKQCRLSTCMSCNAVEHSGHNFEHLWKKAEQTRDELQEINGRTVPYLEETNDLLEQVSKLTKFSSHEKEKATQAIKGMTSKAIRKINDLERELLNELDLKHTMQTKTLEQTEEELQMCKVSAESLINYTNSLCKYGSDAHVVIEGENAINRSSELFSKAYQLPEEDSFSIRFHENGHLLSEIDKRSLGTLYTYTEDHMDEPGVEEEVLSATEDIDVYDDYSDDSAVVQEACPKPSPYARVHIPPPIPTRRDRPSKPANFYGNTEQPRECRAFVPLPPLEVEIAYEVKTRPGVTGMVVTSMGEIVVVCSKEKLVIVMDYTGKEKIRLQHELIGDPWDAASARYKDDDSAIFISDSGSETHGVIVVTFDRKVRKHLLNNFTRVPQNPQGIASADKLLYVCETAGKEILIFSLETKEMIRSIQGNYKKYGFLYPWYVRLTSKKELVISDYNSRRVCILNPDSTQKVILSGKDFSGSEDFRPAQSCVNHLDEIFIADMQSEKIYIVSTKQCLEFPKNIGRPVAMSVCPDGCVIVSNKKGNILKLRTSLNMYENEMFSKTN